MSNENLLQETYEVPVADKVLLDEIHKILDMGFDVAIKRDPDPNHIQIEPYIAKSSIYEAAVRSMMLKSKTESTNNFIVSISENGLENSCSVQSLPGFGEELSDIKMIAKDLTNRIENIKDRFDPS